MPCLLDYRPAPWRAANSDGGHEKLPGDGREAARWRTRKLPLTVMGSVSDTTSPASPRPAVKPPPRVPSANLSASAVTESEAIGRSREAINQDLSKSNAKNYSESMAADPNVTAERRQTAIRRRQTTGNRTSRGAVGTSKPEPPGRHGRSPDSRCRRRCEECGMSGRRVFGDHASHLPGEQFGLRVVVGGGASVNPAIASDRGTPRGDRAVARRRRG